MDWLNQKDPALRLVEADWDSWRESAVTLSFRLTALIGFVMVLVMWLTDALPNPDSRPAAVAFTLWLAVTVWLTLDRRFSFRARGVMLVVLALLAAQPVMARGGYAGVGRLILMVIPVAAVVFWNDRAGIITSLISALSLIAYAVLWSTRTMNLPLMPALNFATPLPPLMIWSETLYTLLMLATVTLLAVQFYRYLLHKAQEEYQARQDLVATNAALDNVRNALEDANTHLEFRVAERTTALDLALADSEQIRRQAVQSNQTKSAFFASVSHDLRTPLGGILGMAGLLVDTPLNGQQKEMATSIITAGQTLLALVNDLLDFSKIEAGRLDVTVAAFNIRACVDRAMNVVSQRAIEKRVNLTALVDASVPQTLMGDEIRLEQILTNLLSNAVKFTPVGEVSVHVSSSRPKATSNSSTVPLSDVQRLIGKELSISFTVQDTGIGISPEALPRLFTAFSQVDESSARRATGTGLGLAISKKLVELMGGQIGVQSEAGVGSTFWFHLPMREVPAPRPAPVEGRMRLGSKRILLVQKDGEERRTLAMQIQGWGMTSRASESPAEAIAWLKEGQPFDAILVDAGLQDSSADAPECRLCSAAPNVPILLLRSAQDPQPPVGLFRAVFERPLKASVLYNLLLEVFNAGNAALPTLQRAPSTPAASTGSTVSTAPLPAETHPLRILVVEDNVINQNLVLLMLERQGYRADIAANGLKGLEALHRSTYDAVLMDVQMPEMDGLEATRHIRSDFPPEQQPTIIAMTANAMLGDRDVCIEAGMDDYISKPIHTQRLVEALRAVKPRAALETPPAPQTPPFTAEQAPAVETLAVEPQTTSTPQPLWQQDAPEAAQEDEGGWIDRAEIDRLIETLGGESDEMLTMLVDGYLRQAEKLIEQLARAAAAPAPDVDALRATARGLQSDSNSFGAARLAAGAREVDTLARTARLDELPAVLERMRHDLSATRQAFKRLAVKS